MRCVGSLEGRPVVNKTAIVIGAGVAGLATAGLLAREGYEVAVVEKMTNSGGGLET